MDSLSDISTLHLSDLDVQVSDVDLEMLVENDSIIEYSEDVWKSLVDREMEKTPLQLQSPQLKFRGSLVKRLRDITTRMGMNIGILHSAVYILDHFMDSHELHGEHLMHAAVACISIAAKSEENYDSVLTLNTLSRLSGIAMDGEMYRQLEWEVGQIVDWKLLSPSPVNFATLLAQFVVNDFDLTSPNPNILRLMKSDGAIILNSYLDITLTDMRLRVVDAVTLGCACVAGARMELGLVPWPPVLETAAGRQYSTVAPIARRLQRMSEILKAIDESEFALEQCSLRNVLTNSSQSTPRSTPGTNPSYSPVSTPSNSSSNRSLNSGSVNTPSIQQPARYVLCPASCTPSDYPAIDQFPVAPEVPAAPNNPVVPVVPVAPYQSTSQFLDTRQYLIPTQYPGANITNSPGTARYSSQYPVTAEQTAVTQHVTVPVDMTVQRRNRLLEAADSIDLIRASPRFAGKRGGVPNVRRDNKRLARNSNNANDSLNF